MLKTNVYAYLSYTQIFASYICSSVLFFFPGLVSYKMMSLLIAFFSAMLLAMELFSVQSPVKKSRLIGMTTLFVVLIFGYLFTKSVYPFENQKYDAYLLVLLGQVAPYCLFAVVVSHYPTVQSKIKQLAPLFGLLFTLIALTSSLSPTSTTSGGFVENEEYGLDYQSTSYMAAYAAGLNLYYIVTFNRNKWATIFRTKIYRIVSSVFVLLNFVTILLSGGRGALVLFCIIIVFSLYVYYSNNKGLHLTLGKIILAIIIISSFVYSVYIASQSQLESNGFIRIVSAIRDGDEAGRDVLRYQALNVWSEKPFVGHGLGSVFYEVGMYSHNLVTDALVEVGLIGCAVYLLLIYKIFRKGTRLIKDSTNTIWHYIFLNGFVMSLFSGYYLAEIPMYWALTFFYFKPRNPK